MTNYNGISPDLARFVGFNNYIRAFSDPNVGEAAARTAVFVLSYVPLNFLVALSLALLINAGPHVRGLFRSLYYLPSVIPVVGAAYIWRALFNQDTGVINTALRAINPSWGVAWFSDFATSSLVSMSLWLGLGLGTVMYLAALQNVPVELEQAALVDGAGYFSRLRHIVFPLISPVAFFQILLALIYALGVVVEPILLATSSPIAPASVPNDNLLLPVYTYQQMFTEQRFGYASALLWITFAGSVAITLLLFATRRFWVHSESGNL
ncbi:carbohydrate ABC transporter permease [Arthrobacter sp. W4I7]|uniref:carbohydrate ABC transporter permease n=1 Tax=Arthrobacter sp. W4I7 TaxID=3042296 RepID=UPI0027D834DA|nr:sugar ABC transporter permease [Arthrobacter sp. W4I7]